MSITFVRMSTTDPDAACPALHVLLDAAAERDALAAAVERVRALHVEQYEGCCNACDSLWPCPTIRALNESEADK